MTRACWINSERRFELAWTIERYDPAFGSRSCCLLDLGGLEALFKPTDDLSRSHRMQRICAAPSESSRSQKSLAGASWLKADRVVGLRCVPVSLVLVMPFSALHAVELQLVMQFCDRRSLMSFARSNRATLAAASAPFAWSCLPPMRLVRSKDYAAILPKLSVGLVKQQTFALELEHTSFPWTAYASDVHCTPHLVGLALKSHMQSPFELPALWIAVMLKDEACRNLRYFQLDVITLVPSVLQAIANHCPLIHTLSIHSFQASADCYEVLASISGLTDLSLSERRNQYEVPRIIAALGKCLSLRKLSLGQWYALTVGLPDPALASRLEHLVFNGCDRFIPTFFDYLAAMPRLRTVELIRCRNINSMILPIIEGRQITRLKIEPMLKQVDCEVVLEMVRIAIQYRLAGSPAAAGSLLQIDLCFPPRSSWPASFLASYDLLVACTSGLSSVSDVRCVIQIEAEPVQTKKKKSGCIVS